MTKRPCSPISRDTPHLQHHDKQGTLRTGLPMTTSPKNLPLNRSMDPRFINDTQEPLSEKGSPSSISSTSTLRNMNAIFTKTLTRKRSLH